MKLEFIAEIFSAWIDSSHLSLREPGTNRSFILILLLQPFSTVEPYISAGCNRYILMLTFKIVVVKMNKKDKTVRRFLNEYDDLFIFAHFI